MPGNFRHSRDSYGIRSDIATGEMATTRSSAPARRLRMVTSPPSESAKRCSASFSQVARPPDPEAFGPRRERQLLKPQITEGGPTSHLEALSFFVGPHLVEVGATEMFAEVVDRVAGEVFVIGHEYGELDANTVEGEVEVVTVDWAVIGEDSMRNRFALDLGRARDDQDRHIVGNELVGKVDRPPMVAHQCDSLRVYLGDSSLAGNPCRRQPV